MGVGGGGVLQKKLKKICSSRRLNRRDRKIPLEFRIKNSLTRLIRISIGEQKTNVENLVRLSP